MFGCVVLKSLTICWSRSSSVLPADQPESVTVVAVVLSDRAFAADATTTVNRARTTVAATAARALPIWRTSTRDASDIRPPPHSCGIPCGYTARPVSKHFGTIESVRASRDSGVYGRAPD